MKARHRGERGRVEIDWSAITFAVWLTLGFVGAVLLAVGIWGVLAFNGPMSTVVTGGVFCIVGLVIRQLRS